MVIIVFTVPSSIRSRHSMTQAVSVHVKQLKQDFNEDFRYIEVINLVAINKPIQKAKKVCNLCFKLATNKVFLL